MRTTLPPIAVIGAGFSGTMAALHLSRLMPERPVLLCEKSSAFARGLAYATGCSDHAVNVRATNMSAFPDQPDHFSRWLEGCPLDGAAWTHSTPAGLFAARGLYGRYLTDLLLTALSKPGPGPLLMLENDEVVDLAPAETGFDLTLAAGRRRRVAGRGSGLRQPAGPARSSQPLRGRSLGRHSARRPTARPAVAHHRDRADHGRCRRGSAPAPLPGPILAVSRHGLLPQVHAATASWPAPAIPAAARQSLLGLLRFLREETRRAASAGIDWRGVIDSLRGDSVGLWRGLPLSEQRRFLRHLRAFWDVHRHRMAPPAAKIVGREFAEGGLTLMRARVVAIDDQAGHARVTVRERGVAAPQVVDVQRIIDASGVGRVVDTDDLLLRAC